MSAIWADRQRRTNRLMRTIAAHLFSDSMPPPTPDQVYGLCKLTWITKSYSTEDASYIKSTKIPALGAIFGRDYSGRSLDYVARDIAKTLKSREIEDLIRSHTGFTNLYNVFRNSSRSWLAENFSTTLPLFRRALILESDADAMGLIRKIERLPGIPKPNQPDQPMNPGHLLTPAFFGLDPRLRFPLINGAKRLNSLLMALKIKNEPLPVQFDTLIKLIGSKNIEDAADLDQVGGELHNFLGDSKGNSPMQILGEQPTEGNELPLKDDSDIETIKQAQTLKRRRLHNTITNKLRHLLQGYNLLEGNSKSAQFDVMVKNFDGRKNDLLIEVKSSIDVADVRMAIGQLLSYWFVVRGATKWESTYLAILLPEKPAAEIQDLLKWCGLGLLWFNNDGLETSCSWLQNLANSH
ncbi:hypothetical protein [Paraburkholderia sp. BL21I4N1]|uniref:hypothetical protein n=1 Tax=Paraburkholderia sp. BL21I4N1 TaxID=1938801 RepID=UPI000D432C0F|nr:hypothetical protein [Paraburkholderia sp. BL21I4N1]PQV44257.1 hypothetical protein B0G83_1255 [Paraburkholderia sp. BL21I4N1]